MKFLALFIGMLFTHFSFPQRTIDVTKTDINRLGSNLFYTVGGEPFSPYKYIKVVEGSAFFNEGWMKGLLVLRGGTEYKNLFLKLDLIENNVHYQDENGREMIAINPIREVVLIDTVSGDQYHFIHFSALTTETIKPEAGWYEILQGGKAKLYKLHKKRLNESRPYGSATFEHRIATTTHYFILNNDHFVRIKKWKELTDVLSDKKADLEKHISNQNLTGKKDDDYISVITYYNILSAN